MQVLQAISVSSVRPRFGWLRVAAGLLSMPIPFKRAPEADQQFGNADSFAMAFDEAWRLQARAPLNREEVFAMVLEQLAEHPFFRKDPTRAREVGEFRLRLFGQ